MGGSISVLAMLNELENMGGEKLKDRTMLKDACLMFGKIVDL